MCAVFAGMGRMGRPVCANLVWAGYVVTAGEERGVSLTAWWPGRWSGGAARLMRWRTEAEVLITILPGSQEQHDVMLMAAAREDQPLRRNDSRAALRAAPRRHWDIPGCAPTWLSATPLMHSSVR